MKHLDKVIAIEQNNPFIAYFNKGEVLRELDHDKEAIECFRIVIAHDVKDARAYFKIGKSYAKPGMRDSACFVYEKAIRLGDPDAGKEFDTICK